MQKTPTMEVSSKISIKCQTFGMMVLAVMNASKWLRNLLKDSIQRERLHLLRYFPSWLQFLAAGVVVPETEIGLTIFLSLRQTVVSMKEARTIKKNNLNSVRTPIQTSQELTIPSSRTVQASKTTSNFKRICSGFSFSFQSELSSKWASSCLLEE